MRLLPQFPLPWSSALWTSQCSVVPWSLAAWRTDAPPQLLPALNQGLSLFLGPLLGDSVSLSLIGVMSPALQSCWMGQWICFRAGGWDVLEEGDWRTYVHVRSDAQSCPTLCDLVDCNLLCMACFRQEYWSRFPFPTAGDLPDPGIEPASTALAGWFFATVLAGSPAYIHCMCKIDNSGKPTVAQGTLLSALRRPRWGGNPRERGTCFCVAHSPGCAAETHHIVNQLYFNKKWFLMHLTTSLAESKCSVDGGHDHSWCWERLSPTVCLPPDSERC